MRSPSRVVHEALLNRRRQRQPCSVILMYHRISAVDVDPWQLQVTPEHFVEQLDVLRRFAVAVPLRRLVRDYQRDRLAPGTVALTFDDGYADNLYSAKPALEAVGIPATVYITTGPTGSSSEFWWDALDRALLVPAELPPFLELKVGGQRRRWLTGLARKGGWSDKGRITRWRNRLHYGVWSLLRTLPDAERDDAIAYLHEWSGATTPPRESRRVMTVDELLDIEQDELIELGAHTVSHPFLPSLSAEQQRHEMSAGRDRLEEILGHRVWSFSYPYGGADETTIDIARSLGFESATTVHQETVRREADTHALPRFAVRDWNGDEFERRLKMFFKTHVPLAS